MKKFLFAGYVLSLIFLVSCVSQQATSSAKVDNTAGAVPLPSYAGPKARIAVADFEIKAQKATKEIGTGLREMLITALVDSGRFSVVERQELDKAMQEQELAASAAADTSAGAPQRGKIKTADLLIAAVVTEFEPRESGNKGETGIGYSTKKQNFFVSLLNAFRKTHMAIDVRIIDTSTSDVLAVTRVKGQAEDAWTDVMANFSSKHVKVELPVFSKYAKTPMEQAIRVCIIEAVRYISQSIPQGYYKY